MENKLCDQYLLSIYDFFLHYGIKLGVGLCDFFLAFLILGNEQSCCSVCVLF